MFLCELLVFGPFPHLVFESSGVCFESLMDNDVLLHHMIVVFHRHQFAKVRHDLLHSGASEGQSRVR